MTPRFSTGPRVFGILLLVLMVSPITAPFSTCDLLDLLGGSRAAGAAVLQSKSVPDDPVPGLVGHVTVHAVQITASVPPGLQPGEPGRRATLQTPLRI